MGKALPFQRPFPAVFSDIDRFARVHARAHVEDHGTLPPGFPDLGPVIRFAREEALSWRHFQHTDPATGLTLRGVPDEAVGFHGGGYVLFDYKTARRSEMHVALLPRYAAQLNLYAYLARQLWGRGPRSLYLIYFSPAASSGDPLDAALPLPVSTSKWASRRMRGPRL